MNRTKRYFNLWTLCLIFILVACSNPKSTEGNRYRTGNFTFVLDDDFEPMEMAGPMLEFSTDVFGYTNVPAPNVVHVNTKDADNQFTLTFNTGFTGVDLGENERIKKNTIKDQVEALNEVLRGGEFKVMKFNGINTIKYSYILGNEQYTAYYYVLDKTQVSFFVVTYPASETEWRKVENAIFKSLERVDAEGDYYAISRKDGEIIHDIVEFCIAANDTLTMDMHREFWETVDRNGGVPEYLTVYGLDVNVDVLMARVGISYREVYYEDALIAYRTGEFFESEKRRTLSAFMEREILEYSNYEIQKIADREPVDFDGDGEKVVVDEKLITQKIKEKEYMNGTLRYNFKMLLDKGFFLE